MEDTLSEDHPARTAVRSVRESAELDYLRQDIPDLLRESSEGLSRVSHIVDDLKDLSQVDERDWQEADLNACLDKTLNLLGSEIKKSGAEINRDFADLPLIPCMPVQINQVLMNLLLNAIQAVEPAGSIRVRTRAQADSIRIEIIDTGPGIPQEIQKRIFEPFFTTKPVGKFAGLGLSVSWNIIKRHHGRIEVHSLPGQGSTFTLILPLLSSETVVEEGAS